MRREGEHFFETIYHRAITGLLDSTVVRRIKAGKYVATRTRASRELDEQRRKYVAASLLVDVPEVEIKICHGGISRVA